MVRTDGSMPFLRAFSDGPGHGSGTIAADARVALTPLGRQMLSALRESDDAEEH
jgi:hypothetical protein